MESLAELEERDFEFRVATPFVCVFRCAQTFTSTIVEKWRYKHIVNLCPSSMHSKFSFNWITNRSVATKVVGKKNVVFE